MATINHVAAVVSDLNSSIRVLTEGFGFRSGPISENLALGVKVSFLEGQNTWIELMQPISTDHYIKSTDNKQLGFNHIAIEVDDIDSALQRLRKIGIEPSGAQFTGTKGDVQNLDPSTTSDLRLQIIKPKH